MPNKYPWDIIKSHQKMLPKILEKKPNIGKGVNLGKFVVFNIDNGKIVIDDYAEIKDFVYLEGPLYIGKHTIIMPQSTIRGFTSIGEHCKIGGEAAASIIGDYTNKAHHGFVGHSYIGSWVNLGAGTTISNLKTTYGTIRFEYKGKKIDTGEQRFGAIIGDYVKTAINTSIYCGKIIGVASHLYGTITQNVPAFTIARGDEFTELYLDSAIETQKRMMARRGVKQTRRDVELLKRVFKLTQDERKGAGVRKRAGAKFSTPL